MILVFPSWCIENFTSNGNIQCAFCAMTMQLRAEGEIPPYTYYIEHEHHEHCILYHAQGKKEPLSMQGPPMEMFEPPQRRSRGIPITIVDGAEWQES